MRDQHYRDKVVNPVHYDRMIDYLLLLNPSCKDEEFATYAIHSCIDMCLDGGCISSTGMCVAAPSEHYKGKVYLYIDPLVSLPKKGK